MPVSAFYLTYADSEGVETAERTTGSLCLCLFLSHTHTPKLPSFPIPPLFLLSLHPFKTLCPSFQPLSISSLDYSSLACVICIFIAVTVYLLCC